MFSKKVTFKDGKSNRFWQITAKGSSFAVTFGRSGTAGQTQTKSFASEIECLRGAEKLVKEKLSKGYVQEKAAGNNAAAEGLASKSMADGSALRRDGPRHFVCTKGGHRKYWSLRVAGKMLATEWGKGYGEPKSTKKSFPTAEKRENEAAKLVGA